MFDLDQILHLMAARGGSISALTLDRSLLQLKAGDLSQNRIRPSTEVFSAFDMLGHCERQGVGAAGLATLTAPCLALQPCHGPFRAVLTGARTGATIGEVEAAAKRISKSISLVLTNTQLGSGWASLRVVVVESPLYELLGRLASELGIAFTIEPAAWEIANASASVNQTISKLFWDENTRPPQEAEYFCTRSLSFSKVYTEGPQCARWKHSVTNQRICAVRNGSSLAFIKHPELGVHIQLSLSKVSSLHYSSARGTLAAPAACKPPRLIARSLALCSGKLPKIDSWRQRYWIVYEQVPFSIAQAVAEKLGQKLVAAEFQNL